MPDDELPPEVQKSLDLLDTELEAIGTEYPSQLQGTPTPPIIHHYTDDSGLRGILQSGKLWLTDVFYLNDPSELRYGVDIAIETLARAAAGGPLEQRIFAQDFRRYQDGAEGVAHYFVLSFSEWGNDLCQWRAYADNGRGYSLGFDGLAIEKAFCNDATGVPIKEHMSFPVCYSEATLRGIFTKLINKVLPLVSAAGTLGLSNTAVQTYMDHLHLSLALQVFRTALFFKHYAYASEKEYRFMHISPANNPPTGLNFRSRPHTLLRYLEFDWLTLNPALLKQIIVGPGTEPRMGLRFSYDCLKAYFPVISVRLPNVVPVVKVRLSQAKEPRARPMRPGDPFGDHRQRATMLALILEPVLANEDGVGVPARPELPRHRHDEHTTAA
jgi:hypothetical protein